MIDTLPNNKAGFQWKVFSIGRTSKVQVDCNMNIKRVSTGVTSATTTTEQTTTLIAQEKIDKYFL